MYESLNKSREEKEQLPNGNNDETLNTTSVRELKPEDYLEVIDVIHKTYRESLGKIYPPKLIDAFCKKYDETTLAQRAETTDFLVSLDQESGEITGIIGLKGNQLRTFFVNPDYQGMGVGRKLYDRLEELAKNRGIREITLEGSPLGKPIYEAFGFQEVETIKKERAGIPYSDTVMIKNLERD